ncbi:hypothetical protein NM688_g5599 [Phlebia brevispora]|uniref:Uncharacterized protein n=1 Tax=Phlebia brevispora TaxID=194682 RepID=A0ACC1ST12_9APHY|nr:hypothetical protein NM688_g5599 [Phlebia brevispora]
MANVIMRIAGREAQLQRSHDVDTDGVFALVGRTGRPGGKAEQRTYDRSVICYNCQGRGHIAAVCPSGGIQAHVADAEEDLVVSVARMNVETDDTLVLF